MGNKPSSGGVIIQPVVRTLSLDDIQKDQQQTASCGKCGGDAAPMPGQEAINLAPADARAHLKRLCQGTEVKIVGTVKHHALGDEIIWTIDAAKDAVAWIGNQSIYAICSPPFAYRLGGAKPGAFSDILWDLVLCRELSGNTSVSLRCLTCMKQSSEGYKCNFAINTEGPVGEKMQSRDQKHIFWGGGKECGTSSFGGMLELRNWVTSAHKPSLRIHLRISHLEVCSCPSVDGVLQRTEKQSRMTWGHPTYTVRLLSSQPRLLVLDNFLEADICEAIMKMSGPRLIRSRVASGAETTSRTSWSTFFTGESARLPLITALEQKIAQLIKTPAVTHGRKPLVNCEAMQVVRYHVGEFYRDHYDNKAGGAVVRAATIIIYLMDTERGGATYFPRAVIDSDTAAWIARQGGSIVGGPTASTPLPPTPTASPCMGAVCSRFRTAPTKQEELLTEGVKILPRQGRAIVFW